MQRFSCELACSYWRIKGRLSDMRGQILCRGTSKKYKYCKISFCFLNYWDGEPQLPSPPLLLGDCP